MNNQLATATLKTGKIALQAINVRHEAPIWHEKEHWELKPVCFELKLTEDYYSEIEKNAGWRDSISLSDYPSIQAVSLQWGNLSIQGYILLGAVSIDVRDTISVSCEFHPHEKDFVHWVEWHKRKYNIP